MKYTINLLGGKKVTLLDSATFFLLNYLRYVIVITQLVVIGVFFYRFQIDQSIVDLKESVEQKKEIIQVVLPLLQQAEKMNIRTVEIRKILDHQEIIDGKISYVLSKFPESIYLTSLEIDADMVKLSGTAINPKHLQSFYAVLKKEKKFALVELQSIKKNDNGYVFSLNLEKFSQ
jgi:Tfp pilus assembly protein PilN